MIRSYIDCQKGVPAVVADISRSFFNHFSLSRSQNNWWRFQLLFLDSCTLLIWTKQWRTEAVGFAIH